MSRRKYPVGYKESVTGCVWLLLGIPIMLMELLFGTGKKKRRKK